MITPVHKVIDVIARIRPARRGDSTPQTYGRRTLQIERLEDRRLLIGTTIITHGHVLLSDNDGAVTPEPPAWVDTMADEIRSRIPHVPGEPKTIASKYTLKLDGGSPSSITGHSLLEEDGSPVTSIESASGEVIIVIDWSEQATSFLGGDNSTRHVGEYVADKLLSNFGNPTLYSFSLLAGPVHLIGHSRGASVNTAIARQLAARGVWVDPFTTLDPHPASLANDTEIELWDNIRFADNYWQAHVL